MTIALIVLYVALVVGYVVGMVLFIRWLRSVDPLSYWRPDGFLRFASAELLYPLAAAVWPVSWVILSRLQRRNG